MPEKTIQVDGVAVKMRLCACGCERWFPITRPDRRYFSGRCAQTGSESWKNRNKKKPKSKTAVIPANVLKKAQELANK